MGKEKKKTFAKTLVLIGEFIIFFVIIGVYLFCLIMTGYMTIDAYKSNEPGWAVVCLVLFLIFLSIMLIAIGTLIEVKKKKRKK